MLMWEPHSCKHWSVHREALQHRTSNCNVHTIRRCIIATLKIQRAGVQLLAIMHCLWPVDKCCKAKMLCSVDSPGLNLTRYAHVACHPLIHKPTS